MTYRECVNRIDARIISTIRSVSLPLARIALFVVFFWFGILKIINASPANPLIAELLERTLPFITFQQFIIAFGIFEMIIGVTFIIPKMERLAMVLLAMHMVTTFLPLILLPAVAWNAPFIPTLEGQYIIKNLALIALAIGIAARLQPWKTKAKQ